MTLLFLKCVLAHLLGDFVLQPQRWVLHKSANRFKSSFLYLHLLVHLAMLSLFIWDINYWFSILLIVIAHGVIDLLKLYVTPLFKYDTVPFLLDQLLHLLAIFFIIYWGQLDVVVLDIVNDIDWALVTLGVFVTLPSGIIMQKLLQGYANQIELDHKSLHKAGQYIGILERLFVFVFIVLGKWEAIGLLIAAKSVFRFNDLKERNNRKLTEYILIGTLLSFGLAIGAGLIYWALSV